MVIKYIRIVLLITAIQFIIGASCNKNTSRPCKDVVYAFEATSEWSPQREIYHVGDTIFLNSTIHTSLTDLINPSLLVDYSNAVGIGGSITTVFLDTILHNLTPALSKFGMFSITGSINNATVAPENGPVFLYAETSSNYVCKLGFVLKEKGLFGFGVSDLKSSGIKGKNCTNAGFSMTVANSNKHVSLYQKALGFLPDADGLKRMYCFSVQ